MLHAECSLTSIAEGIPEIPAVIQATPWTVQLDWLEPNTALLYACAELRKLLSQGGNARIGGGARLMMESGRSTTVVFWTGTPMELCRLAQKSQCMGLSHEPGRISCDDHAVLLLCTAQTDALHIQRGQRTLLTVPGIIRPNSVRASSPNAELVQCLRDLVLINQLTGAADMRVGLGRRILRESMALRIRQLVDEQALAARLPLLAKLLLSRAALGDQSGCFAACAEQALSETGDDAEASLYAIGSLHECH